MREKLIEIIEEAEEQTTDLCISHDSCEDCPGRKYGNNCWDYLKADYLIANGVTLDNQVSSSKWVSVTERLPDKTEYVYEDKAEPSGFGKYHASDYVLVYSRYGITVGRCVDGGSEWDTEDGNDEATHWMPMPEPPKEKDNES